MRSVDPQTLAALLDLLRDHSPTVVAAAREKLVSFGDAGETALREAAESDDARLRVRARATLFDIRQMAAVDRLMRYAAKPDSQLDLEEGAFQISQIEYPDLDRAAYTAILDSLGDQLASRVPPSTAPPGAAAELARLLAKEVRLQMNHEQFDDPDNSFIHRVLDRRKGIPISLAVLYISVARRAELPIVGIGTPGHYLIRYGAPDLDIFIDPTTGHQMGIDACARMITVRGFPVKRDHFEPATTRETFIRMCANLVSAYERRRAHASTSRWARLRDAFRGDITKPSAER